MTPTPIAMSSIWCGAASWGNGYGWTTFFAAYVTDENGLLLHPGEVRERLIKGLPLVLNEDANWNHKTKQTKEGYLENYMAKNLYMLDAHLESRFETEPADGREAVKSIWCRRGSGVIRVCYLRRPLFLASSLARCKAVTGRECEDQMSGCSTGKSGLIFLRQTKKSISGERFFVWRRMIFQSLPGDFRGYSTARNRFYRILVGWAWHALFFL